MNTQQYLNYTLFRMGIAVASSRPGGWFYVHVAPHLDRWIIHLSNGRASTAVGMPVLVLTTVGAKTGQQRITPLVYTPDGNRAILVASNGGHPNNPGWYYNLRAHPTVTASINGQPQTFVAHEATGTERTHLWEKALTYYPGYAVYQRRANNRQIPVMVLTPQE